VAHSWPAPVFSIPYGSLPLTSAYAWYCTATALTANWLIKGMSYHHMLLSVMRGTAQPPWILSIRVQDFEVMLSLCQGHPGSIHTVLLGCMIIASTVGNRAVSIIWDLGAHISTWELFKLYFASSSSDCWLGEWPDNDLEPRKKTQAHCKKISAFI
jgi:hypothetical protein